MAFQYRKFTKWCLLSKKRETKRSPKLTFSAEKIRGASVNSSRLAPPWPKYFLAVVRICNYHGHQPYEIWNWWHYILYIKDNNDCLCLVLEETYQPNLITQRHSVLDILREINLPYTFLRDPGSPACARDGQQGFAPPWSPLRPAASTTTDIQSDQYSIHSLNARTSMTLRPTTKRGNKPNSWQCKQKPPK